MTVVTLYEAYGMVLSSDLALPLPPASGGEPDLVLRQGSIGELSDAPLDREDPAIVASYEHPEGRWYVAFTDGAGYRIRFRDCGEFVLSRDGSSIRWIDLGTDRSGLLPILFAGTVLAFVLTMRDSLVLHASAVVEDGRALAFVGQSGRGKTTLAALTAAAGAKIVTDDVLVVDVEGAPRCRGNAGELRLREGARSIAGSFASRVEQRETADQRLALLTDTESGWVDLAAVVVPRPSREATEVEVHTLPPSEAVLWLLAFPRVHGLRPPQVLRTQFELLSALVRTVAVHDVVVPWGPPFDPGVARSLLALTEG